MKQVDTRLRTGMGMGEGTIGEDRMTGIESIARSGTKPGTKRRGSANDLAPDRETPGRGGGGEGNMAAEHTIGPVVGTTRTDRFGHACTPFSIPNPFQYLWYIEPHALYVKCIHDVETESL